jgi:hypothetical protein
MGTSPALRIAKRCSKGRIQVDWVRHQKTPVFPEKYEGSPLGAMIKMGGTGLELPRETTGNSRSLSVSGAESGALAGREALVDPGLAVVIEAWLTLPAAIKAGILAMVRVGPQ